MIYKVKKKLTQEAALLSKLGIQMAFKNCNHEYHWLVLQMVSHRDKDLTPAEIVCFYLISYFEAKRLLQLVGWYKLTVT